MTKNDFKSAVVIPHLKGITEWFLSFIPLIKDIKRFETIIGFMVVLNT